VIAIAVRAFFTLFVVIDPVGLAPLFVGLVGTRPKEAQARIARRAVLVAAGVLFAFTLGGAWLLHQLDITVDAFRVAGGLLLFRIAVEMVFASHERDTEEEQQEARSREDVSVFPLAIPLVAGPGAMASVMILAGEARMRPLGTPLLLGTEAFVLLLSWISFRSAHRVARALGQTGVNVITRVLGVLLAAMAVQYVADGARGLLAR
jgi:multiple antibiotic resistance protein